MFSQAFTLAVSGVKDSDERRGFAQGEGGGVFRSYVDTLLTKAIFHRTGDLGRSLRTKSNEANYEITLMSKEEAERLITFVEMMLKFIYEMLMWFSPTLTAAAGL